MEIKDLILLMLRNIRTIAMGLILGMALGFWIARVQTPVYEANAKVFVSRARQPVAVDPLSLSDEQLLAINLHLAKSRQTLGEVSEQLGSAVNADAVQAEAIPNTLIIQIRAQDANPQRAAAIVNLLVQALIRQSDALLSARYMELESAITEQMGQVQEQIDGLQAHIEQVNETGLQEQLAQVNRQIEQLKTEIASLERDIAAFPDLPNSQQRAAIAEKRAQANQLNALLALYQQVQTNLTFIGKPGQSGTGLENPSLALLQSTWTLYQQINLTLINNRENARLARAQNQKNVMQIVPAAPPEKPVRPLPTLYLLLGGFVGLAFAAALVLTLDHFDDSIRKPRQVEDAFGLPVLGTVSDRRGGRDVVALKDPHSVESDAFRALGASLEIVGAGKNIRAAMIANANPKDAKTSIAANWAVIHAQQGKRVILLDGDLKCPHLHRLFGLENKKGLADLADVQLNVKSVCVAVKGVDGLSLIAAGAASRDSVAWLNADKLEQFLGSLKNAAELTIVNGPSLETADAQILASKVDAVLLVVRQGHTRVETAQTALERLRVIDANVIGVILDGSPREPRWEGRAADWFREKFGKRGKAENPMASSSITLH